MLAAPGAFPPAAAWKKTFLSLVFGRLRPKTKEKKSISTLPEVIPAHSRGDRERLFSLCRRRNTPVAARATTPTAEVVLIRFVVWFGGFAAKPYNKFLSNRIA
jgi:hypothetical protein